MSEKFQIEWTPENEAKLNELFNSIDDDGDGRLSFDEVKNNHLKLFAQRAGQNPTDQDIRKLCDKLDIDGDGFVSKEEFRVFVEELFAALGDPREKLRQAIDVVAKAMDKDGNGLIDKEEFRVFMKEKGERPLTDAEVDEVFKAVDMDGDTTTLNKDELFKLLQIGLAHKARQQQQQKLT